MRESLPYFGFSVKITIFWEDQTDSPNSNREQILTFEFFKVDFHSIRFFTFLLLRKQVCASSSAFLYPHPH